MAPLSLFLTRDPVPFLSFKNELYDIPVLIKVLDELREVISTSIALLNSSSVQWDAPMQ